MISDSAPIAEDAANPVGLAAAWIDGIRPKRTEHISTAKAEIVAMTTSLEASPELRALFRVTLLGVLGTHRQVPLFSDTGVLPNTGFFTECFRRITETILPGTNDRLTLRDVFSEIFHRGDDAVWVGAVGADTVTALFKALRFEEHDPAELHRAMAHTLTQVLESLRVISYRISSLGLEEEMLRLEPALEKFASPFLAQNTEALAYLEAYDRWFADASSPKHDERHWLVLLDQCRGVAANIRKRAARSGTSFSLTFLLVRLEQNIARARALLEILSDYQDHRGTPEASEKILPRIATLTVELIRAECRKNELGEYLRQNARLMSLRITENAGRTGEHYITATRPEYFEMLRAGLGAGFIIAFMALLKIFLTAPGMPPVNQIIVYGLDYGLGFVLIHMLHYTVATKQPAMTANAIAAALTPGRTTTRELETLIVTIRRTARSQFAGIAGNLLLVIPTSILLILGMHGLFGFDPITPEKADYLLHASHPWRTGTVFYAALAGVFLFLAGIVTGYFDNLCAYNRIPDRMKHAKWLVRLLGKKRAYQAADYIGEHLGALVGNFSFGFMLAGGWGVGMLFGLPVDIRHITFSSANVAFALTARDFHVAPGIWIPAVLGVVLIGAINLAVSFSLALVVAMRSRGVTLDVTKLLRLLAGEFLKRPLAFFLPPKDKAAPPVPEQSITSGGV